MQQWWISAWWDCDVWRKVDFIRQPATTSSVVRLSAPKHFPKPNLYQKKITVTVWWFVACLIHYGFLNPDEIITCEKYVQQINETHQKLQCLRWNWSTEWAQFFSRTTSDHTLHNQHFKSWMNRAMKFCLIHLIHLTSCQLTTTSSSILTTSCRENASTTSRRQKMLSKISLNPKAWVFML